MVENEGVFKRNREIPTGNYSIRLTHLKSYFFFFCTVAMGKEYKRSQDR